MVKTPFSLSAGYATTILNKTSFAGLIIRDGTDTTYRDNNLYKIEVPMIVGAGVGYKASEKFLLALDAELRMFSGSNIQDRQSVKIKPGGSTVDSFSFSDPDYRNSFVLRTGAEYTWETGSSLFPKIPLRAGFAFVPTAVPSVTGALAIYNLDSISYNFLGEPIDTAFHYSLETTSSKAVLMYALSAGFGLQWSQVHVDFAYTFSMLTRSQIVGLAPIRDNLNWSYPAIVSEGKTRDHSFMITFTGYF